MALKVSSRPSSPLHKLGTAGPQTKHHLTIMALKTFLTSLLLASPLALAHPGHREKVYAHSAQPLERKSLRHCEREFNDPEFIKRTAEGYGRELARVRRSLGYHMDE